MKKILVVINTLGRGGAENALIELLKRFDKNEYELDLYVMLGQGELISRLPDNVKLLNKKFDRNDVLSKEGKKHLYRNVTARILHRFSVIRNLPYIFINSIAMLKNKRVLPDKLLWKVISDGTAPIKEKYDLAIAFIEGAATYYVSRHICADKKAAFFHVDYSRSGYTPKLDHGCYENFDAIFGVSKAVVSSLEAVYPEYKDKMDVFYNMIDAEKIIRLSKENGGFDDNFDGIRLLTVCRLVKQKALEISVRAMKIIKDRGYNVRWYVLGEGEERKTLELEIQRLELTEDFILLGVTDNPFPFYREADIYVHCSKFEGLALAIDEAMVLGKPIIAADNDSCREQLADGSKGLLTDFNENSIADAVIMLIENPEYRTELSESASKSNFNRSNINKLTDMIQYDQRSKQ